MNKFLNRLQKRPFSVRIPAFDDFEIAGFGEQLRDVFLQNRMHDVRRDLGERLQHEAAVDHARVRDRQKIVFRDDVAEQ